MSQADIEQLWELQTRQSELRRHVVQLSQQLSTGEKERTMLDVTLASMEGMSSTTKMYKPVGKMFVLTPKDKLAEEFRQIQKDSVKRDDNRISLREQFVAKLKDSEKRSEEVAGKIEETRRAKSKK